MFNFANFSHGDLITLSSYISTILIIDFKFGLIYAILTSLILTALIGVLSYFSVYRPLIKRKAKPLYLMTASFAMLFIYKYITYIIVYGIDKSLLQAVALSPMVYTFVFGMPITDVLIYMVLLSILTFIILWVILNHTRLGIEMRAIADNKELALAIGIRTTVVEAITWLVIGITAGLASIEFLYLGLNIELGTYEIIPLFAVTILSGMRDLKKLLISAIIIGFVEKFVMNFLITTFNISQYYELLIPLIFIIIVLIFLPSGLERVKIK
jgi:branched-subunit amino acid ABC-type transport system permease component